MKKLFLLLVIISTFVILAGCFEVSDVQSIEFVDQPKLVYNINEELSVRVKVTLKNGSEATYNINDPALTVKGFDTATPTNGGYRTLVVSYGSSSISAMYQVVDASQDPLLQYFDGKVEEGDPLADTHLGYYKISNAQHLSNIRYALDQNFVLMNDIDLAGIKWRPIGNVQYSNFVPNSRVTITIVEAFSGKLDGNNKSIFNLTANQADSPEWFVDPTYNFQSFGLFVATEGTMTMVENVKVYNYATIENLTVNINVNTVLNVSVSTIATQANYTKFSNVKVTGSIYTGGSVGGLVGNDNGSRFENCVNEANLTSVRSIAVSQQAGLTPANYHTYVLVGGIAMQSSRHYESFYINCENKGQLTHQFYNPVSNEKCKSLIGHLFAQKSGQTPKVGTDVTEWAEGSEQFTHIDNFKYDEAPVINGSLGAGFEGFNIVTETNTYVVAPNPNKLLIGGPTYSVIIDGVSKTGSSQFPNG